MTDGMTDGLIQQLTREEAAAVASLVAMGAQSGDTILGLSGVRRAHQLKVIFIGDGVSDNTLQEMGRQVRTGARVCRVTGLDVITTRMGREDVSVLAVKSGSMADGILRKLPPHQQVDQQHHASGDTDVTD